MRLIARPKIRLLAAIALGLSFTAANAAPAPDETADDYFGMAMNWNSVSIENVQDTSTRIFGFRYGKMLTERYGLEGRFGLGIGAYKVDDCTYLPSGGLDCSSQNIRVRNTYGLLGRAYLLTDGNFRPYGVLGFSRANIEVDIDGTDYNYSDSSVSYGLGIDLGTEKLALSVEYLYLMESNGTTVDGFSVGFISRF